MNFASRVILAGRSFVSYLLKLAASVKELHHFVHLNASCRDDLKMWLLFLEQWNGVSLFYEKGITTNHDIHLYTGVACTGGFGVVCGSRWMYAVWPTCIPGIAHDEWRNSMTFLELYPIVAAAFVFSNEWRTKKILFISDNKSVVDILKKGRSDSPHVMKLMRKLTWLALVNGFYFSSEWLSTHLNLSADYLSRFKVEQFKELNPDADPLSLPCPRPEEVYFAMENRNGRSEINELLSQSVNISTQQSYSTGFETFLTFILMQRLFTYGSTLPILTEDLLLSFISYCYHQLQLKYSTIKLYLCRIRYNYLVQTSYPVIDISALPRLHAALTCIKRLQGTDKLQKRPITRQLMGRILSYLPSLVKDNYTVVLLKAVLTCSFMGFLRCGEFCVKQTYDPNINLSLEDLIFYPDRASLTLKQSKTDPFRKGVTINLYATKNDLCPRSALLAYIKLRNAKFPLFVLAGSPLFLTAAARPMTRGYFINHLQYILRCLGLNEREYSGHSIRRGSANTCGLNMVPDYVIQSLGRWKSNCHIRYIDISQSTLRDAQIAMSK